MEPDWQALVDDLSFRFPDDDDLYRELARLQGAKNALPEDLLGRGKQIFATACRLTANKVCTDPSVQFFLNDSGPRTSEALTIIPLIFNLIPQRANHEASAVLIAILIARMGLGAFCRQYGPRS